MHYKFREDYPEKWKGKGLMVVKGFTSER